MRALVVEDDPAIAWVERQALERDGFAVSVASTGGRAVKLAVRLRPDVIILDHLLPDMDGMDVIREIRASSSVAIIVVTARTEEDVRIESLEVGADDYIVKPFSTRELLARVHAVLRRLAVPKEPRTLQFLELQIDERAHRVSQSGRQVALTRMEYNILRMLMDQPGKAVDREVLAREIWGLPLERVGKSLDVHMSVLRRKLGDDAKKPRYIQTVRSFGFRLAAD